MIVLALLLSTGCASYEASNRVATAENIAAQHGFAKLVLHAGRFDILAFLGPGRSEKILRVYIEGDGFAWVTRSLPSSDPTPINPLALHLAVLDTHRTAYLARPCQYVNTAWESCDTSLWTSARFSEEIVVAMNDALTKLKQNSGAESLILIGYSGGGTIAALLAARRADVVHLVTVAGNLDPAYWAKLHRVSPLDQSLNPVDFVDRLATIPQIHFLGRKDQNIPPAIFESYRSRFHDGVAVKSEVIPSADHRCCWAKEWERLQKLF